MYVAHSPRPKRGIAAQAYAQHVANVVALATNHAEEAGRFTKFADLLVASVRLAAEHHDMGKLDPLNQAILQHGSSGGLPVNHVDAGVAQLWQRQPSTLAGQIAAVLVHSHHIGLPTIAEHTTRDPGTPFRDIQFHADFGSIKQRTDALLAEYLHAHHLSRSSDGEGAEESQVLAKQPMPPNLLFRIALSCLVDADHFDTASHYMEPAQTRPGSLLAAERLHRLDAYVEALQATGDTERNRLRSDFYQACRHATTESTIIACDSPVGTGKTTAVMAHLLNVAQRRQLRRLFVVLPYTNIITQSVTVYRQSLVFPGEDPEVVVAAHHHRAEFGSLEARHLTYLWEAPVVVTTAVQFFETLAACSTSALRKLHQLAGSAIFIDEAHAALPPSLWPIAWKWLESLRNDWGCHFVLGSGSLQEFWRLPEFVDPPADVPKLVHSATRETALVYEQQRIRYRSLERRLTTDSLIDWVQTLPGPRLLIVNTVQSAAYIAMRLHEDRGSNSVQHLSTALTPLDREYSLRHVCARLLDPADTDWTLVATSCVEAGVDVSFRSGIRERACLTSLLQTAGRVNRSGEFGVTDMWDVQLRHDSFLRPHPAFDGSGIVLAELFTEHRVGLESCTEAMRREIRRDGMRQLSRQLLTAEAQQDYPEVGTLFRVINSPTVIAVVDEDLKKAIENYEQVSFTDLQQRSVQIFASRALDWAVSPFENRPDLFRWDLKYDKFLGYMAGVLPIIKGNEDGGFVC